MLIIIDKRTVYYYNEHTNESMENIMNKNNQ